MRPTPPLLPSGRGWSAQGTGGALLAVAALLTAPTGCAMHRISGSVGPLGGQAPRRPLTAAQREARAVQLASRGQRHFQDGFFDAAFRDLREAYHLGRDPAVLAQIARCLEFARQDLVAEDYYLRFLAAVKPADPALGRLRAAIARRILPHLRGRLRRRAARLRAGRPTFETPQGAAAAKRHAERARKLAAKKAYLDALLAYRRALFHFRDPRWVIELAQTNEKLSRLRPALRQYRDFLRRLPRRVAPALDKLRRQAKQSIARIDVQLASLRITVRRPLGARILIDGRLIGTAPLDRRITRSPGNVTLELRARGYEPYSREIHLEAGVKTHFTLRLPAARSAGRRR